MVSAGRRLVSIRLARACAAMPIAGWMSWLGLSPQRAQAQQPSQAIAVPAPDLNPGLPARPAFHWTSPSAWINDPNGLVYADGVYHLYAQHHPDSLRWGPMHWAHASSRDLLHWHAEPIALAPDSLGMIFSGSVVIDWRNSSGLGRDGVPPWVALFTHHDAQAKQGGRLGYERQSLAYSLDQGQTWTKYAGNPVLPNPGLADFRDPKVCWHAPTQRWVMVLAARDRVLFYTSPTLLHWTLQSALVGSASGLDGRVGMRVVAADQALVADLMPEAAAEQTVGPGTKPAPRSLRWRDGDPVWECPDLIELPCEPGPVGTASAQAVQTRWVLILSHVPGGPNGGSGTRYLVGQFDGSQFVPEHQNLRWLDHGPDNYAGVSWFNTGLNTGPGATAGAPQDPAKADGRSSAPPPPMLIGWMSNWAYADKLPATQWQGSMTLPRRLSLCPVGDHYLLRQHAVLGVAELADVSAASSDRPFASFAPMPPLLLGSAPVDLSALWQRCGGLLALDLQFDPRDTGLVLQLQNGAGDRLALGFHPQQCCWWVDRRRAAAGLIATPVGAPEPSVQTLDLVSLPSTELPLVLEPSSGFARLATAALPEAVSQAAALADPRLHQARIVFDHGSVEVFGHGGLTVLTALFRSHQPWSDVQVHAMAAGGHAGGDAGARSIHCRLTPRPYHPTGS